MKNLFFLIFLLSESLALAAPYQPNPFTTNSVVGAPQISAAGGVTTNYSGAVSLTNAGNSFSGTINATGGDVVTNFDTRGVTFNSSVTNNGATYFSTVFAGTDRQPQFTSAGGLLVGTYEFLDGNTDANNLWATKSSILTIGSDVHNALIIYSGTPSIQCYDALTGGVDVRFPSGLESFLVGYGGQIDTFNVCDNFDNTDPIFSGPRLVFGANRMVGGILSAPSYWGINSTTNGLDIGRLLSPFAWMNGTTNIVDINGAVERDMSIDPSGNVRFGENVSVNNLGSDTNTIQATFINLPISNKVFTNAFNGSYVMNQASWNGIAFITNTMTGGDQFVCQYANYISISNADGYVSTNWYMAGVKIQGATTYPYFYSKLNGNGSGLTNYNLSAANAVTGTLPLANLPTNIPSSSIASGLALPVAVTVGSSPFSFTNNTSSRLECYFKLGSGTAYTVSKNGVAITDIGITSDYYFQLQPTNWIIITFPVGAPTFYTNSL